MESRLGQGGAQGCGTPPVDAPARDASDVQGVAANPRIPWLDAVRGIAILLVLLFHFTVRYGQMYPRQSFPDALPLTVPFGWTGVELFFMISGFVIYMTIQRKSGAGEFLVYRLARIFPPYWLAILLIIPAGWLHAPVFGDAIGFTGHAILSNVFMMTGVTHDPVMSGVFWSLLVEVKFYLFLALLWGWFNLRRSRPFFTTFALLFGWAAINDFYRPVALGFECNFFLLFWLGIAAYKHGYERLPRWQYLVIAALSMTAAFVYPLPGRMRTLGVMLPLLCALLSLAPWAWSRFRAVRAVGAPLAWLGRVSYSCYLSHETLGYLVLGACVLAQVGYGPALLLAVSVCLGLAALSHRYVECRDRPIARRIMAWTRRRKGMCPAAAGAQDVPVSPVLPAPEPPA